MKFKTLGDVHLGKPFKNGVPLHRRGDREVMQWAEFEMNLMDVEGVEYSIQMGDLFDASVVPYSVIYRAAQVYKRAARANPETTYIVLAGNHDRSRDIEKVTAFMLFSAMVEDCVVVVGEEPEMIDGMVFIPWHPVLNAGEMVLQYEELIRNADVVFGHYDVVTIGEATPNMIPAATFKALGVKRAFTGHDHSRRTLEIDGLLVEVTGSMSPYSHGEDEAERFYVTRSLAEVLADPDAFHDKHLRVRLAHGEVLDVLIDCLQLTLIREGHEEEEAALVDVEFEPFDFNKLFATAVEQVGLSDALTAQVQTKLMESRMGDA